MVKYFKDHTKIKHWKVLPMKGVPTGNRTLYSNWKMKRKRDIISG